MAERQRNSERKRERVCVCLYWCVNVILEIIAPIRFFARALNGFFFV